MDRQKIGLLCRVLLGLIYTVFGLNYFFHFIPMPALSIEARPFMGGLASAPYFFLLLKATEIFSGILLLLNFYVPLAVILLAPVTLNIFLFHLVLAPGGLGLAAFMLILHLGLFYLYRAKYMGLLNKCNDI